MHEIMKMKCRHGQIQGHSVQNGHRHELQIFDISDNNNKHFNRINSWRIISTNISMPKHSKIKTIFSLDVLIQRFLLFHVCACSFCSFQKYQRRWSVFVLWTNGISKNFLNVYRNLCETFWILCRSVVS